MEKVVLNGTIANGISNHVNKETEARLLCNGDAGSRVPPQSSRWSAWVLVQRHCRENVLMILTLFGILLGFGIGFGIRQFYPSPDVIVWIGMPGHLYMRLLKMTIMPLIVCSVISGTSSMDPKTNGKVGIVVFALILITHIIAISISMALTLALKPGETKHKGHDKEILLRSMETQDVIADLFRKLFPDNIIEATFRQALTQYEEVARPPKNEERQVMNSSALASLTNNTSVALNVSKEAAELLTKQYKKFVGKSNGINVLGLITISCVFGMAAGKLRKKVPTFLQFFNDSLEVVIVVVKWFFWLTPIGVVSLIAEAIARVDNLASTFSSLGLFVVTVTSGLLIHWFVVLPLLYYLIVRKNPFTFMFSAIRPVSIAFASTNSGAAMPEILHVCEVTHKMDKRVTRIAVPFCVTLNADGSAIFITAATLFIAQYSGSSISAADAAVTFILIVVTCLAIPGVPSASIVTVITILTSMSIPVSHVALLFTVEWFLDRVRSGLNTFSHTTISALTSTLCRQMLGKLDENLNNEMDFNQEMEIVVS